MFLACVGGVGGKECINTGVQKPKILELAVPIFAFPRVRMKLRSSFLSAGKKFSNTDIQRLTENLFKKNRRQYLIHRKEIK